MKVKDVFKTILFAFSTIGTAVGLSTDFQNINGGIFYRNSTLFQIKGMSWFGFETCDYVPHGMWQNSLTWYLDFAQEYQFNVIRVPFSQQWIKNNFETQRPEPGKVSADPSLQGKSSLEILDRLFDECSKRGIFILLDMHRLRCDAQSHELWYSLDSAEYTADTFFDSWQKLIDRYSKHTAFHGIDLLNEPRGLAQWGTDPSTSWNLFVEDAFKKLNYDGLVYVEGVDWGHNLAGMKDHPIDVDPRRIVFSPHVYGPSVVGGNIDMNPIQLHADWNNLFGYLVTDQKAVVIGEWGGRYEGSDREWQDKFVDYLLEVRIPGIYWCLNPNSGDTKGLLDDSWSVPVYEKLALLNRLQPTPTNVLGTPTLMGQPDATAATSRRLRVST